LNPKKHGQRPGSHCDSLGGYLVTITSKGEENFISDKILRHSGKDIWAGATDKDVEGVWKWITNEPFDYTNWYTGEPNNEKGIEDYLELKSFFGFKWNDVPNAVKRNWFICEWDKQPDTNRADSSPVVLSEKNTGFQNQPIVKKISRRGLLKILVKKISFFQVKHIPTICRYLHIQTGILPVSAYQTAVHPSKPTYRSLFLTTTVILF
jgi:hypothetical protein